MAFYCQVVFLVFSSVQSLSPVQLFAASWTIARQASLSITNSQRLLKLMSIESVMPSNHLIVYHPRLLPSIFPSIRVFSNESVLCIRWSKYWSFSFSISPFNEYSGLISFKNGSHIAGIKIAGRNISNLRYADDTTLTAESEEELKSLLMKVKAQHSEN